MKLLNFKNLWKKSTLWHKLFLIVSIKMIIMFAVIKPLFFPNYIKKNFKTDEEKKNFIINELTSDKK